jgi:hypothetical protein
MHIQSGGRDLLSQKIKGVFREKHSVANVTACEVPVLVEIEIATDPSQRMSVTWPPRHRWRLLERIRSPPLFNAERTCLDNSRWLRLWLRLRVAKRPQIRRQLRGCG